MPAARSKARGLQSSIDFMVSYGMALLIIAITIYVIMSLGILNPPISVGSCISASEFSCPSYAIFTNGTSYFVLSQSTGGQINITAAACSTQTNSSYISPAFGNVHVLPYNNAPQYYPDSSLQSGLTAYSNSEFQIKVDCFGPSGLLNPTGLATSNLGNLFTGYLWINYTLSNMPKGMHFVVQVATFTTKYT